MGVTVSGAFTANTNRALAWQSMLFAACVAAATLISPIILKSAAPLGQLIVFAMGAAVAIAAFAFGAMLANQHRHARRMGFVVVALAFSAAALFGLLSAIVNESRLVFLGWCTVTAAYAGIATYQLVRWPEVASMDRPKSNLAIFISYRRDDANDTVGRIYDYLKQEFVEERLFLDVERQVVSQDFRETIRNALEQTDVLLAVIGSRWLEIADEQGRRRLDDPVDLVRREIELAFGSRVRVIPILVQGTKMPKARDLPDSLRPLCYLQAMTVRPDPDFRSDIARLVSALRALELNPSAAP
jgi:hypothetical protein